MKIYQNRLILFITIIFRFLTVCCNEIALVYEQVFDNPYLKLDDVITQNQNKQNKLIIVDPIKELNKHFILCQKNLNYKYNLIQFNEDYEFQINIPVSFAIYQVDVSIIAFTSYYDYSEDPFILSFFSNDEENISFKDDIKTLSSKTNYCQDNLKEKIYQLNYQLKIELENDMLILKGLAQNKFSGLHSISVSFSKCGEGCQSCYESNNQIICNQCYQGFYLTKDKCFKFCLQDTIDSKPKNCVICNEECYDCGQFSTTIKKYETCYSCNDGYKLYQTGDSKYCQIDKDSCEYKQGVCKQCKQNYNQLVLDGKMTCRKQCPQGYYVSNNVCKLCSNNCFSCDNDICQKCNPGFLLIKNKCQECSQTIQGCNMCKNEKICESCQENFFMDNQNQCVSECPQGYFGDQISRTCQKCAQENCIKCLNSSRFSCLACNNGQPPILNQCISYCTSKTEKCIPCHISCEKCNGAGEQNCLQCASGYLRYQQKCLNQCPDFTFQDQTKQECIECDDNLFCLKCKNSQKGACTLCHQERILKNGICVKAEQSCQVDEYYDIVLKKCQLCSLQKKCKGCPNKNNACDECEDYEKLINGACLSTKCNEGEAWSQSQNQCSKCNDKCINCEINKKDFNIIKCFQCSSPYFLYENQCFLNCPSRYYANQENRTCIKCQDQNCKTCSKSFQQCTECLDKKLLQNNSCVDRCEESYYNENYVCKLCFNNQKCLQCENGIEGFCTKCLQGYFLQEGKCVDQCSDYFYQNTTENKCEKCNNHNCLQCIFGVNQCNKCNNRTYLIEGDCLSECPKFYYLEKQVQGQSQKNCIKCPEKCKICKEDNQQMTCLKCEQDLYLINGMCTKNCPAGYFEDKDNLKCEQCHGKQMSCKQCAGIEIGQCKKCFQNFYLKDGSCLENCPKFFYEDKGSFECRSCFDSNYCQRCNGKEENQCEICIQGYHKDMGKCVKYCQINNCDECIIFDGQSNCQKCSKNFYNQNGLCQIECNQGYKPNNQNICIDCSASQVGVCLKISYSIHDNQDNTISVIFSQKMDDFTNYINDLQLTFDGEKDKFQYTISKQAENQILISFNVNKNPDKNSIQIKIEFKNYENLQLSTLYAAEKVKLIYSTSEQNKTASKGITTTTQAASSVAVASLLPLAITGQFQFIASAIDVSQLIYMMGFVNIKSPFNVSEFFQALKDFKVPFKNYFEGMKHYDQIYYNAPDKFEDKEIQGFFLQNAGDSISLTATILLVHLVLLAFVKITVKFEKVSSVIQKIICQLLSYNFYVDLLWGLYLDISLSFSLQLITLERVDYLEEIVNYIFLIFTIIPMMFPFVISEFIRRDKYPKLTAIFMQELNYKYFQIILYTRKLVMGFIIVVFQFQPEVQICFLAIWHIFMTVLIYVKKPYIKKIDNIRNFLQGILFLTGTCLLFGIQILNEQEEKKVLFGWIIILFFGLIIVIEFGFFIKEAGVTLYEKIKMIIQYVKNRKRSKIIPTSQQTQEKVKQDSNINVKDINNLENDQFALTFHKKSLNIEETVFDDNVLYKNNKRQTSQQIGTSRVCFDIDTNRDEPNTNRDDIMYTATKIQTATSLDYNALLNSQRDITNKVTSKKNEIKSLTHINDTFSQNNENTQEHEFITQQTNGNIQNTLENQLQCITQQNLSEMPSPVPLIKRRSNKKRNMSYLLHGIKLNSINQE